ncbi:hypothetical protein, conserved [Babesia bigemina]|uniref:C3H1-type domain-containing protein n=1 Tax=Babesia bigemina TaxID=5866 RepID=A0A061BJD5_BABBI|nr:hypothetical protein, conserved [Babesia bigemina]CDR71586.1 hypothetical protein, conserved [Babesia bigemina]|eukprot:XP_012770532.1 hypothetical protein, conserved [Babesia bigemina]
MFVELTDKSRAIKRGSEGNDPSQLRKEIEQIMSAVKDIGHELGSHVLTLDAWISDAEQKREAAHSKAQTVFVALDNGTRQGGDKKTKLGKHIKNIGDAQKTISATNEALKTEAAKLELWKTEATKVVQEAGRKCSAVVAALNKTAEPIFNTKFQEIKQKAQQIDSAHTVAKQKLTEVAKKASAAYAKLQNISSEVRGQIQGKVVDALRSLKAALQNKDRELRTQIEKQGKGKKCVISGFGGDKHTDITNIKGENVIKPWLEDIAVSLNGPLEEAARSGVDALQQHILKEATVQALQNSDTAILVNGAEINTQSSDIQVAVAAIESQLNTISEMVEQTHKNNDIKDYLTDLEMLIETTNEEKYTLQAQYTHNNIQVYGLSKIYSGLCYRQKQLETPISTIASSIDEITNELSRLRNELKHSTGNDIILTLQQMERRIGHATNSPNSLSHLKTEIGKLQEDQLSNNVDGKIQRVITAALSTVTAVEDLPVAVEAARNVADGLMVNLEQRIKSLYEKVVAIDPVVNSAEQVMTQCILDIEGRLAHAKENVTDAVIQLRTKLLDLFNTAFAALTHQVQSLFAKQKQAELAALENVVTEQLREIERVIEEDRGSGVKGFLSNVMERIEEEFLDPLPSLPRLDKTITLDKLAGRTKLFLHALFMYVEGQVKDLVPSDDPNQPSTPTANNQSRQVAKIRDNLNTLLGSLTHFNKISSSRLKHLKQSHANLTPARFDGNNNRLLDLVRDGVGGFISELEYAYVSAYSKQQWEKEHSTKYAKIGLTIIPTLYESLMELQNGLLKKEKAWDAERLYYSDSDQNPLGEYFYHHGYQVPKSAEISDGELKNKSDFCGSDIIVLINSVDHKWFNTTKPVIFRGITENDDVTIEQEDDNGVLQKLHDCLVLYSRVCHLTHVASPKAPCSVYEMLCWLTGLQFNSVFNPLLNHVKALFMAPVAPNSSEKMLKPINAYPKEFSLSDVSSAVDHICSYAYALLTTILGTGDALTVYACDFSNNTFRFKYPVSGEDCLDMLLDILRRLLPTLQFVYRQCRLTTEHYGWSDCKYGKDVASSKQPCENHSSDESTCEPNYQANCQPTCQPTSPLMSYLNDCLPGHLPHQLIRIGCKYECSTCPTTSKKGMPCLTPLGFKAFSGSTKRGVDISNALQYFFACDNIRAIFSLAPRPPVTLPEHFEFALCLVREWNTPKSEINALQTKFETLIEDTSMWLVSDTGELTNAFINAYGSAPSTRPRVHTNTEHSDVASLCLGNNTKPCANQSCAPYLLSLCTDSYMYLAHKHSDTYLSWAVYLPWTFWNYLYNLYQAFCNIACRDWGCRSCLQNDKCRRGQHGHSYKEEGKPEQTHCQCQSIVTCKGVSPTFYGYGFTFGNAWELNRRKFEIKCSKFCAQLHKVLKSDHFCNLFTQCDEFLFKIRAPFIWLNVSLWLLSLLYLLHIMVVRLDLLHIKSHLHSPSSHRIAAQSLLAAARVNKLNRVFYLQP